MAKVGEVFIIGSGSFRLTGRVTSYNIVEDKHIIDTTGLDFNEQTLYWTTKEVDLSTLMKSGQLQHERAAARRAEGHHGQRSR